MSRTIRNQIFNLKEGTAGGGASDPIQDLVDAYKTYVAGEGGTHGMTDGELYTLYDDAVTAGEITNEGVNIKGVAAAGLYGYKLSGTYITHFYDPFKDGSGNWRSYTQADPIRYPVLSTNKILFMDTSTRRLDIPINYAKNSFYFEFKAKIVRDSSAVTFTVSEPANGSFAFQTWMDQQLRCYLYSVGPTASLAFYPPVGYIAADEQTYKAEFVRTGDNVVINWYKNGSLIGTTPSQAWDMPINTTQRLSIAGGSTHEGYTYKFSLL